jgi:hypothetical protein
MLDHERVEEPPRQPILALWSIHYYYCCFTHRTLLDGQFA